MVSIENNFPLSSILTTSILNLTITENGNEIAKEYITEELWESKSILEIYSSLKRRIIEIKMERVRGAVKEFQKSWILSFFALNSRTNATSIPRNKNMLIIEKASVNIATLPNSSGNISQVVTGRVINPINAPANGPIEKFKNLFTNELTFSLITTYFLTNFVSLYIFEIRKYHQAYLEGSLSLIS